MTTTVERQETGQKSVQLTYFGKRGEPSGALAFGDDAETIASALGREAQIGRNDKPYIRIDREDFAQLETALKAQGLATTFVEEKVANVRIHGQGATIYGAAAQEVATQFNQPLSATSTTGTPKVKVETGELGIISDWLQQKGYKIEATEVESNRKPIVVIREDMKTDTYRVDGKSAINLSQAMEVDPASTPGGRPLLTFDRQQYKDILETYQDTLDISTKPLKLEAKISILEDGRGIVQGGTAQEVAGLLGAEVQLKYSTHLQSSVPQLVLMSEQVGMVKELLQAQGYSIEQKDLPPAAQVALHKNGSAHIFGDSATQLVAGHMEGIEVTFTKNGNPMVQVPAESFPEVLKLLNASELEVRILPSRPPQQASEAPTQPLLEGELAASSFTSPTATEPSQQQPSPAPEVSTDTPVRIHKLSVEEKATVNDLIHYFQATGVGEAQNESASLALRFEDSSLIAATPDNHTLASKGGAIARTNFTSQDFQALAGMALRANETLREQAEEADYDFDID